MALGVDWGDLGGFLGPGWACFSAGRGARWPSLFVHTFFFLENIALPVWIFAFSWRNMGSDDYIASPINLRKCFVISIRWLDFAFQEPSRHEHQAVLLVVFQSDS